MQCALCCKGAHRCSQVAAALPQQRFLPSTWFGRTGPYVPIMPSFFVLAFSRYAGEYGSSSDHAHGNKISSWMLRRQKIRGMEQCERSSRQIGAAAAT